MKANILENLESTTAQILANATGLNPELIVKELGLESLHQKIEIDDLKEKVLDLVNKTFAE